MDIGDRQRRSPTPLSSRQSSRTDGADWTSADEKPISFNTKYAPKETAIVNANAASIVFIEYPLPDELERLSLAPLRPIDHGADAPIQDRLVRHPSHQMRLPSPHFQCRCER